MTGQAITFVTTDGSPFRRGASPPSPADGAAADVTVLTASQLQRVEAFGGSFNEQGWAALAALTEPERDSVMRALFHPEDGLRFNWCRTPIGASDYALDRYTLAETPDDFELSQFSIERDRRALIPYIRAAQTFRPDLKLWASAWTPPTWMKTNRAFDRGAMRDEPHVYAAYARYLAKFVRAYAAENIPVTMVVPQNEPGQLTDYPSCEWTPEQYRVFIREHLGPLFRAELPETRLFVGTINRVEFDVLSVLNDPSVLPYVDGVALQWAGIEHAAQVRVLTADKPLLQSETDCGNWHWQPGYDPEHAPNDFAYGAYTWRKYRDFFAAGSSSYMLWNMVLDEHGKNIDALSPWPQNSAIVVNRTTRQVVFTPMFWATKHFSSLVDIGARLVGTAGSYPDALAFINPGGEVVVQLLNDADTPRRVRVAVYFSSYEVMMPPRSFVSLVVPAGAGPRPR